MHPINIDIVEIQIASVSVRALHTQSDRSQPAQYNMFVDHVMRWGNSLSLPFLHSKHFIVLHFQMCILQRYKYYWFYDDVCILQTLSSDKNKNSNK